MIPLIEANYADLSDEILDNRKDALAVLIREEQAFRRTLNRGLKELNKNESFWSLWQGIIYAAGYLWFST